MLGRRIRDDRPVSVSIAELLRWAITESDNAANDKLMRELGGADAVTGLLSDKGLRDVRVGAYERDLQASIAGMSFVSSDSGETGPTCLNTISPLPLTTNVSGAALAIRAAISGISASAW